MNFSLSLYIYIHVYFIICIRIWRNMVRYQKFSNVREICENRLAVELDIFGP